MRDNKKVFQLIRETTTSIFPLAQDILGPQFEKHFPERRFYQPTFMAFNVSPKPISADLVCKRTPYTNPAVVNDFLAETAGAGYLEPDGNKGYLVSKKGAAAIESLNNSFYDHINQINQFPKAKLSELTVLLTKLVDAIRKADHLNDKVCFEISHVNHIQVKPGTLAEIDQHLDDLNAFRDDAHLAAWTPVGVSGQTWEALNFVWNGEANTAEKLAELLPYRNYQAEDYTQALEDLTELGWIEVNADGYVVTDKGKKIRDDAESATNSNYFNPWMVLSDDQVIQLGDLLTGLKNTNIALAEKNEAE